MVWCFIEIRLPPAALNQFLKMIRWQSGIRFPLTAKCVVTFGVFVCVCLEIARDTESPRARPHYCDIPPTFSSCLFSRGLVCHLQPAAMPLPLHIHTPDKAWTSDSLLLCPFVELNVSGNHVRVRRAGKFSLARLDYYFKENKRMFIRYLRFHCDCSNIATLFTSVSLFSKKKKTRRT